MTHLFQPAILQPLPRSGRYLFFSALNRDQSGAALQRLRSRANLASMVVGLGSKLVTTLGGAVPGLREFPSFAAASVPVPATLADLFIWLRADDRGSLVVETASLLALLLPGFDLDLAIDGFKHQTGRDLTGYEDGTENPKGKQAIAAAITSGQGAGIDGSSFVAIQQWQHDFGVFSRMKSTARDNAIGRRLKDNLELAKAPVSAHVKRTAQESFSPEAFVWRRSMPWTNGKDAGLMYVAFGASFDAFEAQMRRMAGLDDQIPDALYQFTRPLTGYYFWCPPVRGKHLDLRALHL